MQPDAVAFESVSDIDKDKPSEDSVGSYASGNAAEQTASPEEDDPASDLADAPHGKLAADAAAHLARSGYSIEGFGANPQEIDRQAACLLGTIRSTASPFLMRVRTISSNLSKVSCRSTWSFARNDTVIHVGIWGVPAQRSSKHGFLHRQPSDAQRCGSPTAAESES